MLLFPELIIIFGPRGRKCVKDQLSFSLPLPGESTATCELNHDNFYTLNGEEKYFPIMQRGFLSILWTGNLIITDETRHMQF